MHQLVEAFNKRTFPVLLLADRDLYDEYFVVSVKQALVFSTLCSRSFEASEKAVAVAIDVSKGPMVHTLRRPGNQQSGTAFTYSRKIGRDFTRIYLGRDRRTNRLKLMLSGKLTNSLLDFDCL